MKLSNIERKNKEEELEFYIKRSVKLNLHDRVLKKIHLYEGIENIPDEEIYILIKELKQ